MEKLEELGLSKYESRAYLALLSSGIIDARKLSSKSGVPFGRIYDVLSSLESRGLVQTQLSRPKKFLAVEPSVAVKKLIDLKNKEVDSIIQKAGKVEEDLNSLFKKTKEESIFWSVAVGDDTIKAHMERLAEAESELLTYVEFQSGRPTDENRRPWINEVLKVMIALIKKGVKIRLLFGTDNEEKLEELVPMITPQFRFLKKMDVRIIPTISNHFDIIDGEKVQLKVKNPAMPDEYFASIYVWQKEFAAQLGEKFEELWREGKEFRADIE